MNPVEGADTVLEISVGALHSRLAGGTGLQVVDVREGWEWARGHIANAMHIPLGDLPARLGEIDPARDVAFICHMGGRSETAARFARQHGLSHAVSVHGGMDHWELWGFPVEH